MHNVPNIVWLWWEQGWNTAPFITNYAVHSFHHFNPGYDIRLVSQNNIRDYLGDDWNWIKRKQPLNWRSEFVRILLLKKFGGVYADANCFCCVNLDNFMGDINFDRFWGFNIKEFRQSQAMYKVKDERALSSWFYISSKGNDLVTEFADRFVHNGHKTDTNPEYFSHNHLLNRLVEGRENFKVWYRAMTKLSGFHARIAEKYLHLPCGTVFDEYEEWFHRHDLRSAINNREFKIIKMRHKQIASPAALMKKNTVFRRIIDEYLGP